MPEYAYQPYKPVLTTLARSNRNRQTSAEEIIWQQLLRKRQLNGYKFLRQKPIHGYIVDFYCSALQLVIEIDGDIHREQLEYDDERTRILQAHGLSVLRFSNEMVLRDIGSIRRRLVGFIEGR